GAAGGRGRPSPGVPPGTGPRAGVDRDEDDFFDRTELDAGSDPADPGSIPGGSTTTTTTTTPGSTTTTTTPPGGTATIQTKTRTLKSPRDSPQGEPKIAFKSTTKLDP